MPVQLLDATTLGDFTTVSAQRYGPSPALAIKPAFRTRTRTYQQLEEQALRMGRYLQTQGVQKGDRVLLWAPNMPAWVQCFFACHKVGAILVPLDVRSAPDFVAAVLRKTEPKLAIISGATARYAESLPLALSLAPTNGRHKGSAVTSVLLEQLEALLPEEPRLLTDVPVDPDDLAEIMFTSGTTGDPKGVMLSHRNILSNVAGTHQILEIGPEARLLSLLPLSHMLEQTVGMLAPLSGGGHIGYPVSRQPSVLFRTIAEQHVTMLVLVPQALQLFLNAIEREVRRLGRERSFQRLLDIAAHLPPAPRRVLFRSVQARFGGRLRVIICGGAALDPVLARTWELMGVQVLQGYGATEAAPIISCDRPGLRKPGPVGTAFPGVDIKIAPDGEILAHGPNIFRGYWENPAATAQALEDGWYRTGDLGYLDDGFLYLKGRKKDLIVLANGQNVYPEDIERELIKHPSVSDGVVVGLQKEGSAVEVHAVLLMRAPERAGDAVRATNQQLADHQQVQAFTVWPLEDFPRTHTLKVKKRDVLDYLEQMQGEVPPPSAESAAAAENHLYRLIAELSAVPASKIRPEMTLGGDLSLDSLSRVELLSAVEGELGAYVDEAAIAPGTTVAELEQLIGGAQRSRPDQRLVTWPLSPLGSVAREIFLQLVIFPLYHLFWSLRVFGRERLGQIREPVLIAVNHHFGVGTIGFDPAAAWMGLPRALRLKTCTAGEEHAVFDRPVRGFLARLVNAFPLSQVGNVRGSLEYIGRLLDLGWSVLIFPEGKLTVGGPLQPFMGGTGLLAVESRTPVVPMYIHVERQSVIQGGGWPWRGAFSVRLGEPLVFPPGTAYEQATRRIEAAVAALAPAYGLPLPLGEGGGEGASLLPPLPLGEGGGEGVPRRPEHR